MSTPRRLRAPLDDPREVLERVEVEADDVPKREWSGAVSSPVRVVAPTSVKGWSAIWIDEANAPSPVMTSMRKSSIAG